MAAQDPSIGPDDVGGLSPDQRRRLNRLFEYISSKASVNYNNREVQDIQAAVCAMLSRISTRINERGIFNISGIQPCGSQAEKSSVWKVNSETGNTYTEFDFLAVLKDTVIIGEEQPCTGCLEVERAPMRIKLLKRYHRSHAVRKPDFCLCENKGADQLRSNCEADQRLCFRYSDSTIPLLLKSEISSF